MILATLIISALNLIIMVTLISGAFVVSRRKRRAAVSHLTAGVEAVIRQRVASTGSATAKTP